MRQSRFSEEQIVGILRENKAGATLDKPYRRQNVLQTTFYKSRAKYGGMTMQNA